MPTGPDDQLRWAVSHECCLSVCLRLRKGNGEEDDIDKWPWHLKMKVRGGLDELNETSRRPEDGGHFMRSDWVTAFRMLPPSR